MILNVRPTSKITRVKVIICDGDDSHVVSPIWYSLGQRLTSIFCKGSIKQDCPAGLDKRLSHSLLLEGRWKEAGLGTSGSHPAITREGRVWEWGQHTGSGGRMGREKPDPDDIIWVPELTPDLSLDWPVMGANKFLFDLIQSVLGLGPLLGPEES